MPQFNNSPAMRHAKTIFRQHDGILRMTDAITAGIHRRTLYAMRDAGTIEPLSRGLYRMADAQPLANPDLVTVAMKIPQGVICLISALAFHELTTQIPHEIYVAIPRNGSVPRLEYPPVRLFKFSDRSYSSGVEGKKIDGRIVKLYSCEKTLADCFKYRNKIGMETALEALKRYRERRRINVDAIFQFAEINRVANVMRPYLESLL